MFMVLKMKYSYFVILFLVKIDLKNFIEKFISIVKMRIKLMM